jgi:hypothetical protein
MTTRTTRTHPFFAFDRLAALGGYFPLEPGVPTDDGHEWRPVRVLLDQPAALDAAIERVAVRLGTRERPIAASILLQGWAARLTSVYAGSVVLHAAVPDLAIERLHYHQPQTGPIGLALNTPVAVDPTTGWQRIVRDHLDPLIDAIRGRVRIARRLLWGNTASAFAGSLGSLARSGHAHLHDLVRQPWANPPELAGLGNWATTEGGLRFARTTCCGFERLPGRDRCGDCTLTWRTRPAATTSEEASRG